ncbi:MAG: type II toxin-antitoxin system VapC family toxin [Deferrisomatales bacterium]|nr:type II toxin-antitoxin system VapC family toxin [Deferrisomatales bacterium]
MRLLLDTHVFLWSLLEPERLSPVVAAALEAPENERWLSPVSVWETLLLAEKGRVVLKPDGPQWVRRALRKVPFREAPLTSDVALRSRAIELPHQDPADRFLAATAVVYDLNLVTVDPRLLGVPTLKTLLST